MRLNFYFLIKGSILSLFLWLTPFFIFSQEDSIFQLKPVSIEASALRQAEVGCFTKTWDRERIKQISHQSVGDILARESGVFIKSYGGGSLATSSIRGASAGHTAVIWNGLPIASPMLGQMDLALLPAGFIDDLQLQYGGNTALWGSGAIGGTIMMNNHFELEPSLNLQVQHLRGSFGQQDYQTQFQYSNRKFGMRTRFFYQKAENDFSYKLIDGITLREQENAFYRKEGILQEFFWKIGQGHRISMHSWLQNSYREIPPTTVQTRNEAFQEDQFLRTSLNYQGLWGKYLVRAKAGFFHERLDYHDPMILLDAPSRFQTVLGEIEAERTLKNGHKLIGGIFINRTRAISNGYQEPPTQTNIALFLTDRFAIKNWQQQISFRQESVDGDLVSPVISWGTEKELGLRAKFSGKVSRNYRIPTLNDRFWAPGGNPDLKPESGWSQEANLKIFPVKSRKEFHYTAGIFNRKISNWILWSIRDGENFWSANNIARVWSRGIEQRLAGRFQLNKWVLLLDGGYHYTLSTNQETIKNPKIEAGTQLIYVPEHQVFGQLEVQRGPFLANVQYRYTGPVNINKAEPLPSYQIVNFRMNYQWESSFLSGDVFVQLDNLLNVSYRVMERRPMPGRSLLVGLRLRFDGSL